VASGKAATNEQESRSFYPHEVGAYYNYPAHLTGEGQCIGILEFGGGFSQADLDTYFKGINLPSPQVEAISVDGVSNQPGADPDIDGEVMLDIEVASALAPGAKIAVYFAPFTEQGWVDAVSAAVHDTARRPSVLSISWGFTEESGVSGSGAPGRHGLRRLGRRRLARPVGRWARACGLPCRQPVRARMWRHDTATGWRRHHRRDCLERGDTCGGRRRDRRRYQRDESRPCLAGWHRASVHQPDPCAGARRAGRGGKRRRAHWVYDPG
jgi:hypothetical protein